MSPTQYPSRFRPPSPRSRRRTLTPTPTRPHLRIAKARPISPAYDGNGNVRALVKADAANPAASAITARYAYDGFGKEVAVSGADADKNTFRFSTKQLDAETGMNYYGYRYYASDAGRWINRDPIKERGGLNVYMFCSNSTIDKYDYLGMDDSAAVTTVLLGLLDYDAIVDGATTLNYCPTSTPASSYSFLNFNGNMPPTAGIELLMPPNGSFPESISIPVSSIGSFVWKKCCSPSSSSSTSQNGSWDIGGTINYNFVTGDWYAAIGVTVSW